MIRLASWLGAAAIVAAPFLINLPIGKALACLGLALLSLQAARLKAWNMVLANTIGIVGYLFSWLS